MAKQYAVMDGNTAAAHVAYALSEVAAIYPITPSSPMAEKVDEWASKGKKNIFGSTVKVTQLQSEAGAAGTCHGSLQAGALTTSFTSAQGLMLMIPAMFAMAGQFLPHVLHIASRTVTTNHHSIFGDHSDFMACRATGYGMLMSASPQEAMDMAAVAHLSAIKARYAFMHCFDGFRTSHEMQRIEVIDPADLAQLVDQDALKLFRNRALNPNYPTNKGNNLNPDIYFQCKEAGNSHIAGVADIVQNCMDQLAVITGRAYKLFDYYGHPEAERVIVAMCSVTETIRETVDYLVEQGHRVGLISVHLFRPFSVSHFAEAIPKSCTHIAVLDRTKEMGSVGEPLYLDVCTALAQCGRKTVQEIGGRYGLSSKDTTRGQIVAVYQALSRPEPPTSFTIGIEDDVTHLSLSYEEIEFNRPDEVSCKIWGMGGDGTVGANKNAISTIGLVAQKYAQAYFSYDSMKTGGLTQSHLRFGNKPIRSTYTVKSADYVAVHVPTYLEKYDTVSDLKTGGIFLLNCPWSPEEIEQRLPAEVKQKLAEKQAQFYLIDAGKIAREIGLGKRTNSILQAAFFALTQVIPLELAVEDMKANNYRSYFKKAGQEIVDKNNLAVDKGLNAAVKIEIPAHWLSADQGKACISDAQKLRQKHWDAAPDFVRDIVLPMVRQQGDQLPVSRFLASGLADGSWPNGTSAYTKRGEAVAVPKWNGDACVQCNRCSLSCPHAAIRPVLLNQSELATVNPSFKMVPAKGLGKDAPDYFYRIQVSPYDCLGCGVCVSVCPAAQKGALEMAPFETMTDQQPLFDEIAMNEAYLKPDVQGDQNIKSSQFKKPYFQFSAACAGCAETPYIKLVSQLFGDRLYVANAAGCSSAVSGAAPILPYCKDDHGRGPAWEHSLFEDNAEFAYGFYYAQMAIREEILAHLAEIKATLKDQDQAHAPLIQAIEAYQSQWQDATKTKAVSDRLVEALLTLPKTEQTEFVLNRAAYLTKKSIWAIGGDGWAYDIGFGGIDHVMAQGQDVNLLVLDTEVYSNTGGQSSKATPLSAVAKFAASGKQIAKKDLGAMLMSYGYVYVAQVAMGADPQQTLKAIREAESYPGPSIVICYCPCLEQHIKAGLGASQLEMKKAVECGYWQLYRYDPRRRDQGLNPFQLDSPKPKIEKIKDYLLGENRFASLKNTFPEAAEQLYDLEQEAVIRRYQYYENLANLQN